MNIVKKKDLEILLQKIKSHPNPKIHFEQYSMPAEIATEMLFIAGVMNNDIKNKAVIDLGCGTGILSFGASLLKAKEVYGVDIDHEAIKVAQQNQKSLQIGNKIRWIIADISCLKGSFDTVIQNPPFGIKRRGADKIFLEKALDIANIVYSMHYHHQKNIGFIKKVVNKKGGIINQLFRLNFKIYWTFSFHHKKSHEIEVDLYRLKK